MKGRLILEFWDQEDGADMMVFVFMIVYISPLYTEIKNLAGN